MKYSIDYWQRRLQANTQALPTGEQKLMDGTMLGALVKQIALTDDLAQKLEALRVQTESKRSSGSPRSGKKLDTKGDRSSDSE